MIADNQQLFSTLRSLAEAWCDRRCFMALRHILRGYPMSSPLTDGWQDLLTALEDVRAFARSELTEDEAEKLNDCIRAVQHALRHRE